MKDLWNQLQNPETYDEGMQRWLSENEVDAIYTNTFENNEDDIAFTSPKSLAEIDNNFIEELEQNNDNFTIIPIVVKGNFSAGVLLRTGGDNPTYIYIHTAGNINSENLDNLWTRFGANFISKNVSDKVEQPIIAYDVAFFYANTAANAYKENGIPLSIEDIEEQMQNSLQEHDYTDEEMRKINAVIALTPRDKKELKIEEDNITDFLSQDLRNQIERDFSYRNTTALDEEETNSVIIDRQGEGRFRNSLLSKWHLGPMQATQTWKDFNFQFIDNRWVGKKDNVQLTIDKDKILMTFKDEKGLRDATRGTFRLLLAAIHGANYEQKFENGENLKPLSINLIGSEKEQKIMKEIMQESEFAGKFTLTGSSKQTDERMRQEERAGFDVVEKDMSETASQTSLSSSSSSS